MIKTKSKTKQNKEKEKENKSKTKTKTMSTYHAQFFWLWYIFQSNDETNLCLL